MSNRADAVLPAAQRSGPSNNADRVGVVGSASARAPSQRDGALDVLRGYCIASMITSHVGSSTVTCKLLHLPKLFDGAIGFVFLSGLVLGMVHRRRVARLGVVGTRWKLARRAGLLWSLHVGILLLVLALQSAYGTVPGVPTAAEIGGWPSTVAAALTLRLQPRLNDILPMYVVFLLMVPVAIGAFERGKGWLFLGCSAAFYTGSQFAPSRFCFPGQIASYDSDFVLGAWQFPFFLALYIGYGRERLQTVVWPRIRRWALPASLCAFCAVFLIAQTTRHSLGHVAVVDHGWLELLFDKRTVRPGYLLYYLSFLVSAYWMLRRYADSARVRFATGWLQVLGRASLYCYLVHLVITEVLDAMEWETYIRPAAQAEVLTIGVLVLVCIMARYKVFGKVIPN